MTRFFASLKSFSQKQNLRKKAWTNPRYYNKNIEKDLKNTQFLPFFLSHGLLESSTSPPQRSPMSLKREKHTDCYFPRNNPRSQSIIYNTPSQIQAQHLGNPRE